MIARLPLLAAKTRPLRAALVPYAQLLPRLTLGVVFLQSGYGKITHIDKVIGFFTELGLPAADFQAHLVACTELVGGALVLVGLATRFAAAPLAITMVVALLTAKRSEIHGFGDLFGEVEWTYLVMFLALVLAGAGRLSFDDWFARRVDRDLAPRPS